MYSLTRFMAWALLFSLPLCSYAQENPQWDAHWITSVTGKYYPDFQGVVMYRKTITLDEQPAAFPVKVSADNRYELFVNGQHVGRGPAYSVPQYWNYETYDLAKFLREGNNVIAARVWNYGNMGPWAQFSLRTAFIMQGNNQQSELVNTGLSWKVKHDPSRSFFKHTKEDFFHLTGVGPCEKIDAALFIDGWNDQGFDDSNWLGAEELSQGRTDAETWDEFSWRLTPSVIPQMDGSTIYLDKVVRTKGVNVPDGFVNGNNSFSIPPNTTATILFDNTTLTATYPMLEVDGGNNAEIRMIYSEALFDENNNKIHRDIAEGMTIKGYYDIFLPDGKRRIFSPLWFRTYRYLELRIETRDEPLQVIGFKGELAAYPFELKADFESSDPYLEQIFKTGWRTGRLCAFENYVDCPYYEQLQYFGDQNISNQVTLYLSGDARLMKSGILQGKYSINQEGITMCAAPNRSKNVIPFFSLAWVGIIYNYYMYTGDQEFINTLIPDIEGIIEWYADKINDKGMLGPMPYWNFVDCNEAWPWDPENGSICEPAGTKEGNSSILTLQYAYGLDLAIQLFSYTGNTQQAEKFKKIKDDLIAATFNLCWDAEKNLMADTPEKTGFSQHANIFAALTGQIPLKGEDQKNYILNMFKNEDLIQASTQSQAYYHKVLKQYGLQNYYLNYIGKWKQLIDWGFTTFPEYPELNTRSDCHAWSAYPAYEMLTMVCGISITSPGFQSVEISPAPGDLDWIEGAMPWKDSFIVVNLKKTNRRLKGTIRIPEGLKADFSYSGERFKLQSGENVINVKN